MQIFNTSLANSIINGMKFLGNKMGILSMQLATGNRLVNAGVDPAGLAISEKMRAQLNGLNMAYRNVQDSMSMLQTADGALSTCESMTQRIRELLVQASSDSLSIEDRNKIQYEINQYLDALDQFPSQTEFNTINMFDGRFDKDSGNGMWVQSGANAGQGTTLYINNVSLAKAGLTRADFDLTGKTADQISAMIDKAEKLRSMYTNERSNIGAQYNRLQHTANYLQTASDNTADALSRITDTDMAKTMMEYVKSQMQMQASMTMLSNLFNHERTMMEMLLSSLRPSR